MEKGTATPTILDGNGIKLAVGQVVMDLIFEPIFQESWLALYHSCHWSTVFQSPEFVTQWYSLYHLSYDPIIVYAYSDGRLTGMICLAGGNNGKEITGAGRNDAHYQGWISLDENKESFIIEALEELGKIYKKEDINLIHLPPNAPIGWVNRPLNYYCGVRHFSRPLIQLNRPTTDQLMKKKQYRENIKRLNRLGTLRLEKITDTQTFQSVLDELAVQYDFRQGAIYNHTPFKRNAYKKEFYTNLFKKGLLYVTVLRLDEKIIASVIGTVGKNRQIHGAGINSQSPYHNKFSPGFLNFIMFVARVEADGYGILDLSTGEQVYKNRLANTFDKVTGLYISLDPNKKLIRKSKSRLRAILDKEVLKLDVKSKPLLAHYRKKRMLLKEKFAIAKTYGILPWIKNKLLWSISYNSLVGEIADDIYRISQNKQCTINKNSIKDLLDFEPDGSLLTKWEFLYDSMKRIEAGEIPYTWTMDGRLLACVWVSADDSNKFKINTNIRHNGTIMLRGLYLYNKGSRSTPTLLPKMKPDNSSTKLKCNTQCLQLDCKTCPNL